MRCYGPLASARFDPHPEPAGDASGESVLYAAGTLLTAVAERFQHNREIRLADPAGPVPMRGLLALVDVRGPGAVHLGASYALSGYRKDVTRRWARAIRAAWPAADGLCLASAMTGEDCVVLWAPAADSFPAAPDFARRIGSPAAGWQYVLRSAAGNLGYTYG